MRNEILQGDCLEKLRTLPDSSVDSIVTDPPYGISFMGKKWDYDVPKVEVWEEALRVLKPGGHALVACGTRTQHRMAVNLEDAGFEIRDVVAWVYGSGFPKSLNIGKAVDKLQGNEREVLPNPKAKQQTQSKDGIYGDYEATTHITKGHTPYEGWGTALKPAMELWTLCRKPLAEKNVAANVTTWGTGGLNIDGCRVALNGIETHTTEAKSGLGESIYGHFKNEPKELSDVPRYNTQGRFPANFITDGSDEVVGLFPETGGGGKPKQRDRASSAVPYTGEHRPEYTPYNDTFTGGGSAARFFYCAKASKAERNAGLEGFEKHPSNWNPKSTFQNTPPSKQAPKANHHPTVKPVKLMRYLVRLITPAGGVCLDPYGGSGSTALGCIEEGFDFVIIEREPEYVEIIKARVKHYQSKNKTLFS